jgi:hypothetical protein
MEKKMRDLEKKVELYKKQDAVQRGEVCLARIAAPCNQQSLIRGSWAR